MRNTSSKSITQAALFVVTLLTPSAFAVDGQMIINQSVLNAAGGTITITLPGSYKLSGNLQAKDQATPVILIASNDVTIDLNGFAITGIADCSSGIPPCANENFSGKGISTAGVINPYFNITVRNGTIRGMGGAAIYLQGDSFLVEFMHIRSNGASGIFLSGPDKAQLNAIVQHNNVQQNGHDGILLGGGRVTDNVVTENFLQGIEMEQAIANILPTGTVAGNVVRNNGGAGLHLSSSVSYIGNSLSGNSGGNVSGGFNQGQNLCGGAACPGAVF